MPQRGKPAREVEHPLVSVIIPAWNAEATLLETLESAAAQTYPNIEIVIVDDGSTDRTAAIAAEFCEREPRAKLVRQENRGLSAARNRGVQESSGPWIAPLDADDLWHPAKVEKQVRAALEAAEEPGFVYCLYRDIDARGYVLGSGPRTAFNGSAFQRLIYQNTIHTLLLSRSAAERVGGYDESLRASEDTMIQLAIARHYPVAGVAEHLVGYRKRPDSMSRDTDLVIRSWRGVLRSHAAQGAKISPRLTRWMEALFRRLRAEEALGQGDYGKALRLFTGAVLRDPLRWGSYTLYRMARTAARLARGRRRRSPLLFSEVDPQTYVSSDPDEIWFLVALLDRLESRRLKGLAASETLER